MASKPQSFRMSIMGHFRWSRPESRAESRTESRAESRAGSVKEAEQKVLSKRLTFHHLPKHAARDALISAPQSTRTAESARVLGETHERAFGASRDREIKMAPSHPQRADSGLSNTTYSTRDERSRFPSAPSSASSSVYATNVSFDAASFSSRSVSLKGKEVDRSGFSSPYQTPSSPTGGLSINGGSVTSLEVLDTKPTRPSRTAEPASVSRPPISSSNPHRLHPSARRPSDTSSVDRHYLTQVARLVSSTPTAHRSSVSQSTVVPVQQTPPTQRRSPSRASSRPPTHPHSRNASTLSGALERHSRQGSASSLPSLTPSSVKHHSSGSGAITPLSQSGTLDFAGFNLEPNHSVLLSLDYQPDEAVQGDDVQYLDNKKRQRRESRSQYQEKAVIDASLRQLDFGLPQEPDGPRETESSPPQDLPQEPGRPKEAESSPQQDLPQEPERPKEQDVVQERILPPAPLTPEEIMNKFRNPNSEPKSKPEPTNRWKLGKPGGKLLRKHRRVDSSRLGGAWGMPTK